MTQARTQTGFLGGKLLIASPLIGDPRFDRALVYMCSHDDEQAMGLIINRPMEGLRLPDLLEQLEISDWERAADMPVFDGGPVDRDRGMVLHTDDAGFGPASMPVEPGISLSATKEILDCLVSETPPRRAMMALGYAGWASGQLEDEIAANAWLVCDADEHLLFDTDSDAKWAAALSKLGVTPEFLTAASGHA